MTKIIQTKEEDGIGFDLFENGKGIFGIRVFDIDENETYACTLYGKDLNLALKDFNINTEKE